MSARTETKDVAGIFDNRDAAATAVQRLLDEHYGAGTDLSVIVSKQHEREVVPIDEPIPAYSVASAGAGLGAIFGGLVVAFIGISFGPFTLIEWGRAWAIFEGAYVGACVGMALGAIMSIEMAHAKAVFDRVRIRDGVVWVGLHASEPRAERARQILAQAGARHVMERDPATEGHFDFRHAA